jgi:hypothetical protein
MSNLSPLQIVKRDFGSKDALVEKLVDRVERYDDESSDDFRRRLRAVSNRKLLRLNAASDRLERDFTNKEGLVAAIVGLQAKGKGDGDRGAALSTQRVTRLLDLHDSTKKS